jgi:hypothetical protein
MKKKVEDLALYVLVRVLEFVVPPPKTLSARGAGLTAWEVYFLEKSRMGCPDCELGELYGSSRRPNRSFSPHSRCGVCEAEFAIAFVGRGRVVGLRMGDGVLTRKLRGF